MRKAWAAAAVLLALVAATAVARRARDPAVGDVLPAAPSRADFGPRRESPALAGPDDVLRRALEGQDVEALRAFRRLWEDRGPGKADEAELIRAFPRMSDPEMAAEILWALGDAARDDVPAILPAALNDARSEVRRAALGVIARRRLVELLPVLERMLETDAPLRSWALKAVGALGAPASAAALARFAAGDAERGSRDEAYGLLQSVDGVRGNGEIAALLIPRLEAGADPGRIAAAAYAVGRTDTPAAAAALLQAYERSKGELREDLVRAAFGMTEAGGISLMLRGLAESKDPRLKRDVVTMLANGRRPELLPVLAAEYERPSSDADYRIHLAGAADVLGLPEAEVFLRAALSRETDPEVREALVRFLDD